MFLGCGIGAGLGHRRRSRCFPDALSATDFGAFVTQGVILVGSAVAIVATNDDIAIWGVSKLGVSKRTLAARLGFAYPLARVFRTSMLLGMYSIVIFTLTFLSVFSNLFAAQAPRFARDTAAGYDVLVDSNYSNPVPAQVILDQPGVASSPRSTSRYPSGPPTNDRLNPNAGRSAVSTRRCSRTVCRSSTTGCRRSPLTRRRGKPSSATRRW